MLIFNFFWIPKLIKANFARNPINPIFFLKKKIEKNSPLNTPEDKISIADVWPVIGLHFGNHFKFRYTFFRPIQCDVTSH